MRASRGSLSAVEAAAGVRPVGWVSPGNAGSENTPDLLVQEGFVWQGDRKLDNYDAEFEQHFLTSYLEN